MSTLGLKNKNKMKTFHRYLLGINLGMCCENLYRVGYNPISALLILIIILIISIDLKNYSKK